MLKPECTTVLTRHNYKTNQTPKADPRSGFGLNLIFKTVSALGRLHAAWGLLWVYSRSALHWDPLYTLKCEADLPIFFFLPVSLL